MTFLFCKMNGYILVFIIFFVIFLEDFDDNFFLIMEYL